MKKGFKIVFMIHFIVSLLLGILMFVLPNIWARSVNWSPVDPVMMRFYGSAMLAFSLGSLLGFLSKTWEQIRILVLIEIVLTVLGFLGALYEALFVGAPAFIWVPIGLIGAFAGCDIPAVGFSLGLERILWVMEERGMFPELRTAPDVLVCGLPDVEPRLLLEAARRLRGRGLRVEVHPEPQRKLGKQLAYASELGASKAAILGSSEAERGVLRLKDLETGEQTDVPL